jgi:hypothetical protein
MFRRLGRLLVALSCSFACFVHGAPGGTYGEWTVQAWGVDRTNAAFAARQADPDLDGIPNFLEYALGLDPVRQQPGRSVAWSRESADGAAGYHIRYRNSPAAVEAQLALRWSRTLGGSPWLSPDQQILADLTNALTETGEILREGRLHPSPSESAAFARLTASEVPASPRPSGFIWFEAEPPNGESHTNLSGGQMVWSGPGAAIQKTVTIPADGVYTLWVRKFWNPQTFRWRVGTADAWKTASNPPIQDLVELGPGRKVGWISVGDVALAAGSKTFRLEVTDMANTTAYDCFVLTRQPFIPRGKLKPGEPFSAQEPNWFAFQPENDPFDLSPIDLRRLNEDEAGDGGFIGVRGEEFIHSSSGKNVRFWAVNTGNDMSQRSNAEIELFARTLAKRGVNLVRLHGAAYVSSGAGFGQVQTNQVYRTQQLIRALKRQGIYSCLSFYFPLWVRLSAETPAFPGYNNGNPFALLYFNPEFQAVYRTWLDALLCLPNPETGIALKDEPALAMVEMVNEDSLFFWTFNPEAGQNGNIPDAQRARIEQQFGDWLLRKYPGQTLAQIRSSAWGGLSTAQDAFVSGRVGFRPLWNIANERTRRDRDTAQFLTELQTAFYRGTYAYLKQTLGYRGLVYASNWQTASAQYLGPLDKWSNTCADFMDRHGYFGGYHSGTASGYAVQAGQQYDDRTALKFQKEQGAGEDFNNPLFDIIYNGQPSTITEVNWTPPSRFRAEFPILAAAYGCLQGSDAIFHFAAGSPAWDGTPGKFSVQTPAGLGQFPAAALLYRQGLVQTAPRVVNVQLLLSDLYSLKGTPIPAPVNFDQLRGDQVPPGATLTNVSAIDSLAFTVGRVAVEFRTNGVPQSQIVDLSPFIDRTNRLARSHTGELEWNWAHGLVRIAAPAAQGMTGFLGAAGTADFPDVRIQSDSEYGAILLVSLDERPLAQSSRMLMQVMTEEKPFGWATDASSGVRTIINAGQPPVMVRNCSGLVQLKRADAATLRVSTLDFNGYREGPPTPHAAGISLRPDQLYYLIEE